MSTIDPNAPIDPNTPPVDPNTPPPTETVDRAAYDQVKADMLANKQKVKDLQAELENKKLQGFREKEDWKSIAEQHEAKAKEFETKYSGLQTSLVNTQKHNALVVEAQKQGINPNSIADLEMLDFEEITVETTTTGKIIVSGADRAIASLKLKRPHWFTKQVPGVNPNTPDLNKPMGGDVTLDDLKTAEAAYLKSRSESDKVKYNDLIIKYKSQRRGL